MLYPKLPHESIFTKTVSDWFNYQRGIQLTSGSLDGSGIEITLTQSKS